MITSIRLRNYFCFLGDHEVKLGPGIYAVTARHIDDPGRSNWLGKSTFLSVILFALYGTHAGRTEDEFITDGEKEGYVEVHLVDGVVIKRSRKRGKSTQLTVKLSDGTELSGKAAQEEIVRYVGLNEQDFLATDYFEQRKMAEFILAQPSDRMKVVSSWLRLAPLQACYANVSQKLSALIDEDTKQAHRQEFVQKLIADALVRHGIEKPDDMQWQLDACEKTVRSAAVALREAQAQHDQLARWRAAQDAVKKYDAIVAEGTLLKGDLAQSTVESCRAAVEKAQAERDKASTAFQKTSTVHTSLTVVAAGEFDGKCPVVAMQCPAREKINAMRAEARAQLVAVKADMEKTYAALEKANGAYTAAQNAFVARSNKETRQTALREQAKALKEQVKLARSPEPATPPLAERVTDSNTAATALAAVKQSIAEFATWQRELDEITAQRSTTVDLIAVLQYALVVFGRNGAQRLVAENALTRVQNDANAMLAEAGIELEIEVKWAREGEGLATHCETCGAAFPASRTVKVCSRCNAVRGQKVIDKLDVELSDRSGAAEDLAGIAFQFAASAWLRKARNSKWSVAAIDEPFGALDETNRRALSVHFATLLRSRFGFEQAFIVAHDRGIMDSLPDRVEIIGTDLGSKFVA